MLERPGFLEEKRGEGTVEWSYGWLTGTGCSPSLAGMGGMLAGLMIVLELALAVRAYQAREIVFPYLIMAVVLWVPFYGLLAFRVNRVGLWADASTVKVTQRGLPGWWKEASFPAGELAVVPASRSGAQPGQADGRGRQAHPGTFRKVKDYNDLRRREADGKEHSLPLGAAVYEVDFAPYIAQEVAKLRDGVE